MKRVGQIWFLSLACCWEETADPCPAAADRYRPDLPVEAVFDTWVDANEIQSQPCAGELTWEQAPTGDSFNYWVVVGCWEGMCTEGYVGDYCVSRDEFTSWAKEHCPECLCQRTGNSGELFDVCHSSCDLQAGAHSG